MADTETDALIKQIKADREARRYSPTSCDFISKEPPCSKNPLNCPCALNARILADAEVIKAAEDHLVKRLKALRTYFNLSDEEFDSMTHDERADTLRQHGLIVKSLTAFRQAQQARAALKENNDEIPK